MFEGKRVVGPKRDIVEIQNAIAAYADADSFKPGSVSSLLKAHGVLLKGLRTKPGKFRTESVGIIKGSDVVHTAPPADRVQWLVKDLLSWSRKASSEHPIIRSAVVHYELAFIHPFMDGNGRTCRFWQHVMLLNYASVFDFVPMESVIEERQADYYRSLSKSDSEGASTPFIEFSLQSIHDALAEFLSEVRPKPLDGSERLQQVRKHFGGELFSRKEYMNYFKTLSSAQASRDLRLGTDDGVLAKEGKAAQTRYRFRSLK